MNHNKSINNKKKNIKERENQHHCDQAINFLELLYKDESVTIHKKNVQALAIVRYKIVSNIAPAIVSELIFFFKY